MTSARRVQSNTDTLQVSKQSPTAISLVRRARSGGPLDPGLARDLLNVTTGEARVAALVGSGMAPRDAAERLGITEETARTTLKRVFAKVGVSRQSELAALLARLTLG